MVRNMGRNAVIFANIRMITLWGVGCTALTFHLNCTKIQPYYDVHNVKTNCLWTYFTETLYINQCILHTLINYVVGLLSYLNRCRQRCLFNNAPLCSINDNLQDKFGPWTRLAQKHIKTEATHNYLSLVIGIRTKAPADSLFFNSFKRTFICTLSF